MFHFEHSTECYLRPLIPIVRRMDGEGLHKMHAIQKNRGERTLVGKVPCPTMRTDIRQDIIITRARAIFVHRSAFKMFLPVVSG